MAAPRAGAGPPLTSRGPVVLPACEAPPCDPPITAIFRVSLTDDMLSEMAAQAGQGALQLTAVGASGTPGAAGALHMGGQALPVTFRHHDTKRASEVAEACFTHRDGQQTRSVGIINGFADVKRPLSKNISSLTKKRTLDAANEKKKSHTLLINSNEEPRPKRSRASAGSAATRRPVEKRPRPAAPRSAHASPLNALTPGLNSGRRISVPGALTSALPSALPSATPSPHVSPPGLPSGASASRAMASRANSLLGPGQLPPRSTPPGSSGLSSARVSAAPSPAHSRGPSPARGIGSAPSSPRTGGGGAGGQVGAAAVGAAVAATASSTNGAELQRHVIHLLALQDMSVTELRKRLSSAHDNFEQVRRAAKAIATSCGGAKYRLKRDSWRDVSPEYEGYSVPERDFVRREAASRRGEGGPSGSASAPTANGLSTARNGSAAPTTGSGSSQGSAVSPSVADGSPSAAAAGGARKSAAAAPVALRTKLAPVDAELDKYVHATITGKKTPSKLSIRDEKHYADARKQYAAQWVRYVALHSSIGEMKTCIASVREERKQASIDELASLDKAASAFLRTVKGRWEDYCKALKNVHGELMVIRKALADYPGPSTERESSGKRKR